MKSYIISNNAAGQRLDRYLSKLLPAADQNLLQKSLRKKNITLNQKKADPKTILKQGDTVSIYFSDETIRKFSGSNKAVQKKIPEELKIIFTSPIFENDGLLVINKPAGLLTQPDASGKLSLSDCISVCLPADGTFHPAPANRLDLNTSGIILIPKDYETQKTVTATIREHRITKEYLALVSGEVTSERELVHHLQKNTRKNHVAVSENNKDMLARLTVKPLYSRPGTTLVSVSLETGKSHQIRVQLASDGHPIVGDPKYGNDAVNAFFRETFGLRHQLLHSRHYAISEIGLDVKAPLPEDFRNILKYLDYPEV